MSKEITAMLQTLAPQRRSPGQARAIVPPATPEKSVAAQNDRVTLTDTARMMHLSESKQGPISPSQSDPSVAAMTNAQRPSPAMANLIEAFLTTSDMEGFDASSDLNDDGVVNFQDLAALRDIETAAGAGSPENPKALFKDMTESFLSSEGSDGFDVASDLNDDGMINFQDLALLRSRMEKG